MGICVARYMVRKKRGKKWLRLGDENDQRVFIYSVEIGWLESRRVWGDFAILGLITFVLD